MGNKHGKVTLAAIGLPDFGDAQDIPQIPLAEYQHRLKGALDRMKKARLDILAVYADREHSANLSYLTGFDPRFEEALLLLDAKGNRFLAVGNECMGCLPDKALKIKVELFQFFSLMGQPRDASRTLKSLLSAFGVGKGKRIGCVGWKYFDNRMTESPAFTLDIPSFLADAMRELAGGRDYVLNANGIFMDPEKGMRLENSAAQIARFEYAAVKVSQSVLRAVRALKPGVREKEAAALFDSGGLTLSCHPMMSFGEKARRGLSSPSDRKAEAGEPFTMAFGAEGALTSRAGFLVRSPEELPEALRKFYMAFSENYFSVLAAWYESLRINTMTGEVFKAAERTRNPALFDFALNPGHYIHLDEWVNSPFEKECRIRLRSGMALQADIIPVARGHFCVINGEDGVALADSKLQKELKAGFPEAWDRIRKRKAFMKDILGIRLHDTVLPLSNTVGWIAPYAFSPDQALVRR